MAEVFSLLSDILLLLITLLLFESLLQHLCCSLGSGEENEQGEPLMDSFTEDGEYLECFRCDLGFWDTCYTTQTKCGLGERCFTGRGKAGVVDKNLYQFISEH